MNGVISLQDGLKKTSGARSHIVSWKQIFLNTNKVSACSWRDQLPFEMLLGQCKVCLLSEKDSWQYGSLFIHLSDYSLAFLSIFWQMRKNPNSKFTLNEEHRSIILRTKYPPEDFKSIAVLSFRKMLTRKWWRLFHPKWRIQDSKFLKSGFSDGNHCLNWSCSISTIAEPLNETVTQSIWQ